MPRSVIGPFALETPLGIDPKRSNVYRAMHIQQKKTAAIRLFSTPLGLTPESKQQFAAQIEDLKELRHPGITRCYGGGFEKKEAFLAYEWLEGESLDLLLQRRGSLPWETSLDYALQIAEALQYASEQGWQHHRLRPDKIMICEGGLQAKVTDIRREDDALWMTPLQLTPQQRLYLAPEALQEPPLRNERSDVYSLGVILYVMLTGQTPFDINSSLELLDASIQRTVPPNVSSVALDCPVWLSTLVAQMLQKEPLQRPYSMAAVVMALNQARTRAAGGVSVAEHVASGFNPLQIKADRKEVEKILGRKKERKPLSNPAPWLFNGTTGLIAMLLIAISAVVWLMRPLDEATLRRRAEALLETKDSVQMNTAMDEYLLPLLERFPQGQHAAWAREMVDDIEASNLAKRIEVAARLGRDMKTEAEQKCAEAFQFEKFGDHEAAAQQYRAIVTLLSEDPANRAVVALAQRRLKELDTSPTASDALSKMLQAKLDEADQAYENGKMSQAKQIWQSIIRLYQDNNQAKSFVDTAKERIQSKTSASSTN